MTTGFPMANTVRDNPAQHRFEMDLGDSIAVANYTELPGALAINHTEVPSEHGGQGVGSELVRQVLEILRSRGLKVVPRCPFITYYLKKHPEYNDLLAS